MAALRNAGALDLVAETVAAGATPADARKWWLGELLRTANKSGTELGDLPITPADVARVAQLVDSGAVNDRLAREVIEGVLAGEGTPDEVVKGRGLAVVSDDAALTAAVDEAIAAQPGRRPEDPGRQGRRGRRPGRRGDEGHPGPGRRQPGPGTHPRPPRLSSVHADRTRCWAAHADLGADGRGGRGTGRAARCRRGGGRARRRAAAAQRGPGRVLRAAVFPRPPGDRGDARDAAAGRGADADRRGGPAAGRPARRGHPLQRARRA